MTSNTFFVSRGQFTITDIASWIDNSVTSSLMISGAASLNEASPNDIACFHNPKYRNDLTTTKAGAVLITSEFASLVPKTTTALIVDSPYRAFGKILSKLYQSIHNVEDQRKLAFIHPTAKIGENCIIGANSVIKAGAVIGHNSVVGSMVSIGENVSVGDFAQIEDHVTLSHTIIGDHFYVKPGARIGQSGFGFHMDQRGHFDVPQLGCVRIGNNVQIGANTTIDRGSQSDTIIGNGARIDNLVQIAHNVELGDNTVLVAQVGVAGSSKLGKFVIAAGQVGIAGHLTIGNNVKIAAQSGLMRDVKDGETIAGSPAIPVRDWHKQTICLAKLIKEKRS